MFVKKVYGYIFLFLFFINSACNKDITLDLQAADIRPVVFGIAKADKPIDLIVQKSYPLLTYTDTLDKNIKTDISLFVNDNFKEILSYKNNHYYSVYIPQVFDKLKISFEWKGIAISSEGIVPNQIIIDSVRFIKNNTDFTKSFYIYFKDNPNIQNYYAITATVKYRNDTTTNIYYSPVTSKSPLIGNEEDMTEYEDYQSLMFSDTLFNGKNINIAIEIEDAWLSDDEELLEFTLSLSNIDKNYYTYVNTYLKNQAAQTPNLFFGDVEYINVHSNISNGYGIFKTFTMDTKDIKEYF